MTKQYKSFDEIDERLKILNLQREIYKESLKLDLNKAKTHLFPAHLANGLGGMGLLQKLALSFVAKKLLQRLRSRKQKELIEQH